MIRAPAWAFVATAAAVATFSALGVWQVRRGLFKQSLQAQLADRAAAPERLSYALGAPQPGTPRRAEARGRYLADQQLLQDGQANQHRPGFHVWTPLVLEDESAILVNRGWIPADRTGFDGSAPAGVVTLTGFWRAMPEPGVRLAGTDNCPAGAAFPAVVLYPTSPEVECLLKRPFVGGLLLLDPEMPGGYVREWTDFGFPPQRHYGYAVQWFALAIAALVVFVVGQPQASRMSPLLRARLKLLLLAVLFFAPVIGAIGIFFYAPEWFSGRVNYGTLVSPARPVPDLALTDAAGAPAPEALRHKWSLVYLARATCDEACTTRLMLTRQVRLALNEKRIRVQRVYVAPDAAAAARAKAELSAEHPDLVVVVGAGPAAKDFFQPTDPQALYLLDPLGNWLMVYTGVVEHKGLHRDLKKLLRISQVG